ncbi:MAG: transposase [Candidatus Omnitrophica bacterium]|nr:transposase [Candidatus Omnitrophota bacterium]
MARRYRVVVPGFPHHVAQRGNRRMKVFFCEQDRQEYMNLLKEHLLAEGVQLWAYCLMDNHVHLVLVPSSREGLARAVGDTHRFYTRMVNFRERWRGYLWQGRFGSFVMGETYLLRAIRYVERNPLEAGLTTKAEDYSWSSARAHIKGEADSYLSFCPLLPRAAEWGKYVNSRRTDGEIELIRKHNRTGRPFGDDLFLGQVAELSGISVDDLKGRKPGRPRKI